MYVCSACRWCFRRVPTGAIADLCSHPVHWRSSDRYLLLPQWWPRRFVRTCGHWPSMGLLGRENGAHLGLARSQEATEVKEFDEFKKVFGKGGRQIIENKPYSEKALRSAKICGWKELKQVLIQFKAFFTCCNKFIEIILYWFVCRFCWSWFFFVPPPSKKIEIHRLFKIQQVYMKRWITL